jgi:hypothetical protein
MDSSEEEEEEEGNEYEVRRQWALPAQRSGASDGHEAPLSGLLWCSITQHHCV